MILVKLISNNVNVGNEVPITILPVSPACIGLPLLLVLLLTRAKLAITIISINTVAIQSLLYN